MAGANRYYHFDHQGTTQCLTDSTGAVTDRFASDAWGVQVKRSGSSINRKWYIGAPGYRRDADVEMYLVRDRYLAASRARWLARGFPPDSPIGMEARGQAAYEVKRTGNSINRQWYVGNWGYHRYVDRLADYVRARSFAPCRATWLSRDSYPDQGAYRYVHNRPTVDADPSGNWVRGSIGDSSNWESVGYVYTCKCGWIDIVHFRGWTNFAVDLQSCLRRNWAKLRRGTLIQLDTSTAYNVVP